MHYHPDLAAALAEARTADLHAAAARGRHDASASDASHEQPPRIPASIQLDAYPRLCGLPVTIERLAASGAGQADGAASNQRPPDSRNRSATDAAKKHLRRRGRLFGRSKRDSVDHDRTYSGPQGGQHPNHSGRRKPQGSSL
jgi:hypothetical protein